MGGYRELEVWPKAMHLATAIYALARKMPKQEEYRIISQLIRAAVSIPANIAEGNARGARKDYAHFISIARGSAAEFETLQEIASRAALAPEDDIAPLMNQALS